MIFKWNMNESEWKRMIDEHINHIDNGDNVYGNLYVGRLCLDFCHSKDESAWFLYVDTFELGKDTGYGYTKDGIPYDLLDSCISIPVDCKMFDDFKKEVEKHVIEMIKEDGLEEQANDNENGWR